MIQHWHQRCVVGTRHLLRRRFREVIFGLGSLFGSMLVVASTMGCSAAADDLEAAAVEEGDDESWGEPALGKADGVSAAATLAARRELAAKFTEPALSDDEQGDVLERYSHVDAAGEAPRELLERALVYYDVNHALLENTRYLTLVDFSPALVQTPIVRRRRGKRNAGATRRGARIGK